MGSLCSCLCSKQDEDSPGDKAFDEGGAEYDEYRGMGVAQRNSSDAQTSLSKAIKSYNSAADYYRKNADPNLGAALLNLATVKWHLYQSLNETATEEKTGPGSRSANLLEEVIKHDEEALGLWQVREAKPNQYPTLLANLAAAYRERFERNKQSSDVQQAIKLYKDTRNCTDQTTKPHVEAVKELGITYWTWYNDASNVASRKDEQLQSAIQYLMNADGLAKDKYPDIQFTCLYTLAWISHHQFERQEDLSPLNPNPQYLNDAIHFYRSTLQTGMPHNDPRYAKALWFVPMLLFHRYEKDKGDQDLQEAQWRAREALNFPGITDAEQLKQLTAVRDFDSTASPETTRDARRAMRRSTMDTFRSASAEYSTKPSATMETVLEVDAAGAHSAGVEEKEKRSDQFGFSGSGTITNEPLDM